MKTRVISSIAVVAIIVLAIASRLLTPYIFDAVMIIAGVAGTLEVARAFSNNRKTTNEAVAITFVLSMYIGILYAIFNKGTLLQLLLYVGVLMVAYVILTFLITLCFKEATKTEMLRNNYTGSYVRYSLIKAFRTIISYIYPALLFAILLVINHLDAFYSLLVVEKTIIKSVSIFVDFIIIATFVCSTFTDTFAMLIGCKVRGPKLCPKISPNKTISGAIGGWLFGIIGVLGVYMLYSLNESFIAIIENFKITWLPIVIFAIFAPILEQIGDIVASLIKRKNFIKDYSNLIPGHGGVMDRVDGLLFVGIASLIFSITAVLA